MAKKSKKDLKIEARQAASTGSLSKKQVNQLKDAGVKSAVVSNIKSSNQTAKASNQSQTSQTNNQTQTPLTGNAVKDGRYGIGAQKEAVQNYNSLVEQGVTDAFNPGRPGSRANIMADGFVGKKELNKFAKFKEIDASQARKRLATKGAAFTAGANKRADSVFSKNNPMLQMMINSGFDYSAGLGKGKQRQLQIFKDSSSFDYSNKLPSGEVFEFRNKYGMVGGKPNPNVDRLTKIFGNPDASTLPINDENNNNNDNNDNDNSNNVENVVESVTSAEPTTDPGVGQMSGGGMGAMGATKLGRARSRLQRLGIIGRGTGLLGRGLQYGNSLNA